MTLQNLYPRFSNKRYRWKALNAFCLFLFFYQPLFSETGALCSRGGLWLEAICTRLYQIWTEGSTDIYESGYAWHNRYTYSEEKVKSYNEFAAGGGIGKGFYDEKGNWHGLTAIAFLDSHKNLEPAAGYVYLKMFYPTEKIHIGGGYSILFTARPDILHNIPFPGVLPFASLTYKRASLMATYIPGSSGAGNVFYVLGKWTFDTQKNFYTKPTSVLPAFPEISRTSLGTR